MTAPLLGDWMWSACWHRCCCRLDYHSMMKLLQLLLLFDEVAALHQVDVAAFPRLDDPFDFRGTRAEGGSGLLDDATTD